METEQAVGKQVERLFREELRRLLGPGACDLPERLTEELGEIGTDDSYKEWPDADIH